MSPSSAARRQAFQGAERWARSCSLQPWKSTAPAVLAALDWASSRTLAPTACSSSCLTDNVEPGSRILTDGWAAYPKAIRGHYTLKATSVSASGRRAARPGRVLQAREALTA